MESFVTNLARNMCMRFPILIRGYDEPLAIFDIYTTKIDMEGAKSSPTNFYAFVNLQLNDETSIF